MSRWTARIHEARRSAARIAADHPRHLVLAWLVLGLLAGPHSLTVAMAVVLSAPIAQRGKLAVAMIAAALAGALVAHGRAAAVADSALRAQIGHVTTGRATLLEAPTPTRFGQAVALARFHGERVLVRGPSDWRWASAPAGSLVALRGVAAAPDGFERRRGAAVVIRSRSIRLLPGGRGGLAGAVDHVRERAELALARGVPAPHAALLQGMVLGDDHGLSHHVRDDFRASGLSHLTAASGANVMLLAALTTAATTVIGVGLRIRLAIVLALIAVYVPLAGGGPSIQRAGVMGGAGIVAAMVGRPASRWYGLGLAAAATLAVNPLAAEDPGWQMSFAAVAAIFAGAGRMRERLAGRGIPAALAEAVAVTLAAGLATAPIIAWHFERVSLVAPAANVLAVPAVAPVMWLGMVAAALGQAAPSLAAPVALLAAVPAGYLMSLAQVAATLPAATVGTSALVVLAGAAVLTAAAWFPRVRRLAAAAAVVAGMGWLTWRSPVSAPVPEHLRITFLDVGQGDATLVQHGRTALLVDAGPPEGHVVTRLRDAGVRRLDALVVTHAQLDHDGGAPSVLAALPVGVVVDGRDGLRSALGDHLAVVAAQRHIRLVAPAAGEVLRAGPLEVRVLWPPREAPSAHRGADPNARAIVSLVRDGGVRLLLTADVESEVLASLDLPAVDVLKVAHHGSADPGLGPLLARLRPALAVISVGARNPYGHPSPATVRALSRAVPRVYRTDRDGTVQVDADGRALLVRVHAGAAES